MNAQLFVATRDYLMGSWQSVFILVWRDKTTFEGVTALEQLLDGFARDRSDVFLLTVVEERARIPSFPVRDALATVLDNEASRLCLSAVVYEGTGFRAAAVRAVVSGLALMSKISARHRVFSTVADATAWFQTHSAAARRWAAPTLARAVAEMRESAARGAR